MLPPAAKEAMRLSPFFFFPFLDTQRFSPPPLLARAKRRRPFPFLPSESSANPLLFFFPAGQDIRIGNGSLSLFPFFFFRKLPLLFFSLLVLEQEIKTLGMPFPFFLPSFFPSLPLRAFIREEAPSFFSPHATREDDLPLPYLFLPLSHLSFFLRGGTFELPPPFPFLSLPSF